MFLNDCNSLTESDSAVEHPSCAHALPQFPGPSCPKWGKISFYFLVMRTCTEWFIDTDTGRPRGWHGSGNLNVLMRSHHSESCKKSLAFVWLSLFSSLSCAKFPVPSPCTSVMVQLITVNFLTQSCTIVHHVTIVSLGLLCRQELLPIWSQKSDSIPVWRGTSWEVSVFPAVPY